MSQQAAPGMIFNPHALRGQKRASCQRYAPGEYSTGMNGMSSWRKESGSLIHSWYSPVQMSLNKTRECSECHYTGRPNVLM